MAVTLWHNPRCSKSRQTLALLEARGVAVTVRDYQKSPPSLAELQDVLRKLGQPAGALMRWKDSDLAKDSSEGDILAALAANPKLIERPVAITQSAARIGRPPEAVLEIV
ncbi:arsenate reductase (glutaredoxin) [uncultured Thioclava sp.]|jgi:arsenate reductase|uniref:arsenate reductase (glutaredoxin) n=1 Tax=uncultured Thioclava sp. TaxID=473858 RepID=UPI0025E007EE|nr:arsenate reductase (glutaredoxin) [uncultured Thioclava sp.]